ncbi:MULTISPECIES: recombination mediator RecR [Thiorhodovibrio]|uniref:recombination mediator RecR n=1 Tax=Thiorhodovibrio TaxID=61593 RepID=UPI001A922D9E|nr:recombination mediator RecR [Thiorhodovibrio winogradskyi]WPL11064.1 Recombination protein RecR [Thiorhodovibrio litoralis]
MRLPDVIAVSESHLLPELIDSLRCLPGVGPKSAQRMAFYLLERDRDAGRHLAAVMASAMDRIGRCESCRTLTEAQLCSICASSKRDQSLVCVVEGPSDVAAIEQATEFSGVYFVLGGRLSPLDGIGPDELELDRLQQRLAGDGVTELILAISPTIEGSATSHYIAEMAAAVRVPVTRIAHGVPLGGELEYVDGGTLAHAFSGRQPV